MFLISAQTRNRDYPSLDGMVARFFPTVQGYRLSVRKTCIPTFFLSNAWYYAKRCYAETITYYTTNLDRNHTLPQKHHISVRCTACGQLYT